MIPSALFCCLSDVPEIRALELSDRFFTFRVTGPDMVPKGPVTLCFRERKENRYREICVRDYRILEESDGSEGGDSGSGEIAEGAPDPEGEITEIRGGIPADFCRTYRFETEAPAYREAARKLTREYLTYIEGKLSLDDASLAELLTGYPAALEALTSETFAAQKERWNREFFAAVTETGTAPAVSGRGISEGGNSGNGVPGESQIRKSRIRFSAALRQFSPGVLLDRRELWEDYLRRPAELFFRRYLAASPWGRGCRPAEDGAETGAQGDAAEPDLCLKELWVGNAFCPNLFPETEMLVRILRKAWKEDLRPAVVLPWIAEHDIPRAETLISGMADLTKENGRTLEFIVNDWGTAELIRNFTAQAEKTGKNAGGSPGDAAAGPGGQVREPEKYDPGTEENVPYFSITPGPLLMKRRKDVRLPWKLAPRKEQKTRTERNAPAEGYTEAREKALTRTLADDADFRKFLRERYGTDRYVLETAGAPECAEGMHASLLFPWYQMNTAQYCTLYAAVKYGDRGHQEEPVRCPRYCEEKCFLYPDFLHMTGRYNSLFGLDTEIWKHPELLIKMRASGADRIIFNFL